MQIFSNRYSTNYPFTVLIISFPTVIFVILAVVTLQAFTRGKSFYLGKISPGKFISGFIFPRLKGHTGDHWTLGGLTSQRIKFQFACSKFWRKNGKHARESSGSKRGFYSYFIPVHYFLSKRKTSKSNFTPAPDLSKDSKTTKNRI